jgi:DNA modification methylase
MKLNHIYIGDAFEELQKIPDNSIDCCVTSPPYYGLRNYGVDGQIGLEETPEQYIEKLVKVFCEVRRVLCDNGTLWLNIGDSYAGSGRGKGDINKKGIQQKASSTGDFAKPYKINGYKNKDLIGIPWMLAFALRANGWYLRQDIIWHKPNPMPESVTDRCTKSHEYIFLLTKSAKYYFDNASIKEPAAYDGRKEMYKKCSPKYARAGGGFAVQSIAVKEQKRWQSDKNGNFVRNKRDVWTVCTKPEREAHFACFPPKLIVNCIKAGCPEGGTVLDPFMGSGTTAAVAQKLGKNYVGIELNPEYVKISERKLKRELGMFAF